MHLSARYLSGIVAGLKTKANKIDTCRLRDPRSFVASTPSPSVSAPSTGCRHKRTHTWRSAKEKDAAKALLDECR